MEPSELIERFADKKLRNDAIVRLVGAINAGDLRKVVVSPEAKQALIEGLRHPNAKVRWWCLQLMDHLADESYLQPMLGMLKDPVAKVRRHAIHALSCGLCKPDRCRLDIDIEQPLREVLRTDPDEKVRREVEEALQRLSQSAEADGGS